MRISNFAFSYKSSKLMWHSDRWSRMLMVSAMFIEARGWEVLDAHPTTRLEYDESDHFHVIVMLTCFCKAYLLKLVIILFFILAWPRKAKGIQRYDLCQYVISENVDHFVNWRFDFLCLVNCPPRVCPVGFCGCLYWFIWSQLRKASRLLRGGDLPRPQPHVCQELHT